MLYEKMIEIKKVSEEDAFSDFNKVEGRKIIAAENVRKEGRGWIRGNFLLQGDPFIYHFYQVKTTDNAELLKKRNHTQLTNMDFCELSFLICKADRFYRKEKVK